MAGISTSVTDTDPANVDPSTGISNGEPGTANAPIITEGETALYAGPDPFTEPETKARPENRTPGIYVGENLDPAPSLYVDNEKVASTYDPVSGMLTPVEPLNDGYHTFQYTLSDTNGNESQRSRPLDITVDGAPDAPVISAVTDDVGTVTGAIVSGGVTNDAQPQFTGAGGEAGAVIALIENGSMIGTAIVAGDGTWSVSPTAALADGNHSLTLVQIDTTGHTSPTSSAFNLTVNTVYSGPNPVVVPPTDHETDNRTPGIYVGENLDPVPSLYVDGEKVASTYDPVIGMLTPVEPLRDGDHTFQYTLTDSNGNESQRSDPLDITVYVAPHPLVLTVVTDEMGYVARTIESNVATTDTQPVFHGIGGARGARISLQNGGVEIGWSFVAPDGTWTVTPTVPLTDGSYTLTLVQLHSYEGTSEPSEPFHLIVDTHVSEPVIKYVWSAAEPSAEPVKPVFATGETNNTRPVISGAGGGAGSTIRLMDRNAIIGTATVAADGTWNVQPTAALSDGVHSFTIVAVDKAGKVLGASSAVALTIDTLYNGPDPEVAPVTDQPGVAYPPIEVASVTGTNWSFTDSLSAGGNHVYTAHVVNQLGQTSSESAEFSLNVLPNFTISGNVFSFGEGNHTLDLTKVPDGLLSGVETIDIGGNGANTINLNEHDVLDLSATNQILKIKGTGDDTVRLDGNAHFALSHPGYVDGKDGTTYDVYENSSNGTLVYIDHDINNVILI
ncbi:MULTISPECIES: Ig-like domain-containing protein [Mesorhizobium]|uniref:Bacterial Ig-like domain-containing protein n=1 Tax=Mesorhizobium denitrificans TaxID=2294114 RepID=A0A371XFU3_9HYPH|nr:MULTISPECIES: Ig-like domain-containing protein [Mesorhizobium]RFC68106.1 hypothetical protein DY251_07450 [Mesorhizobium denitrificans]